jgi:hypothetical protein
VTRTQRRDRCRSGMTRVEWQWKVVGGKSKDLGKNTHGVEEYIFLLKTINSDSSCEPLLISFISSGYKLELLLIILALIRSGSNCKPLSMMILSVAVHN